uniref:A4_EXTRA domain-containing protein n=2 Tax=Steinernema glaseri TaxID=37863 RepID=A0A1I8AK00_9BILA
MAAVPAILLLALAGCAFGAEVAAKSSLPMVAFYCGYRNQFVNDAGLWTTDNSSYSRCAVLEEDIMKYCQKVYPYGHVTSAVKYQQVVAIGDWRNITTEKVLPAKRLITPYRCLSNDHDGEEVLVPKGCKAFVVSKEICRDDAHWLQNAQANCQKIHGAFYSHQTTNPCSNGNFKGASHVCCPKDAKGLRDEKSDESSTTPRPISQDTEANAASNVVWDFVSEYWKFMVLVLAIVLGIAIGYLALRCERRDGFEQVSKEQGDSKEDLVFEYRNTAYSSSEDKQMKPTCASQV